MSSAISSSSMKPKCKSKSISNLPLPDHSIQRLTPHNATAPSSPSLRTRSKRKTSTHHSTSSISRTASIRSPPIHSLSPLPSTETLSYFPPFESMGSEEAGEEIPEEPIAGPSRPTYHTRGKSLSSLAGLMSACLSTISPSTSMASLPSTDDEVVQALTKRCTPGKGKRRVLEPLTVNDVEADLGGLVNLQHKRRMRSEVVVADMLVRMRGDIPDTKGREGDEEEHVERMVSYTPSKPSRKPHMTLQVPLTSLPSWRFPLPSPPIASLSPDIPNDAFHRLIDNPLSTSRETSPLRQSEEEDQIEHDLSPTRSTSTSSSPSSSPPRTPPHKLSDKRIRVKRASTSPSLRVYPSPSSKTRLEGYGRDLKLERSVSAMSSDSKRTIRPGQGGWQVEEGEITPKAGRGYGGLGVC